MIDRLGKLGDASDEKDTVFNRLLVPSATSEWDIGRLGHRREVARKLLGRLSAYLKINQVSIGNNSSTISTTFLEWLSEECSIAEKPKKSKHKLKAKAANTSMLLGMSSVMQSLDDPVSLPVTDFLTTDEGNVALDAFRPSVGKNTSEGANGVDMAKDNIRKAIENIQPDILDLALRSQLVGEVENRNSHLLSMAVLTLQTYMNLEQKHEAVTRIVVAYVPKLSSLSGSPELWQLIFSSAENGIKHILESLLCRCMASWCADHISSCCDWLLSTSKTLQKSPLCVERITRFLLLSSGQMSVHMERFSTKITVMCIKSWGKSEEFVASSTVIAMEGMKQATSTGFHTDLLDRNYLPDWLILVLALAKCGRSQMKYICEAFLQSISQATEDLSPPLLRAVFLRLYVSNPHGMNLGTAKIRSVLMEAAEEYSESWLDWRSPLDDQLQDMLDTVMSGSGQRLVRPLSEISKKHPLLVLRKTYIITSFLESDAEVSARGVKESRGVVHGQNFKGSLKAVMSGKLVTVEVKHWGYSYSEKIWIWFLDVLSAGE
jgi:hypothetical protein